MDHKLAKQLLQFITKVAAYEGKTIEEFISPTTEPDDEAAEGLKFYEDLLKNLKPEKAPSIPYIDVEDREEDARQEMLDQIMRNAK